MEGKVPMKDEVEELLIRKILANNARAVTKQEEEQSIYRLKRQTIVDNLLQNPNYHVSHATYKRGLRGHHGRFGFDTGVPEWHRHISN